MAKKINLSNRIYRFSDNDSDLQYIIASTEDIKIVINGNISEMNISSMFEKFKSNKNGSLIGFSIIELFEISNSKQLILSDKIKIHFYKESENKTLGIMKSQSVMMQLDDLKIEYKDLASFIEDIISEDIRLNREIEEKRIKLEEQESLNLGDGSVIENAEPEEQNEDEEIINEIKQFDLTKEE